MKKILLASTILVGTASFAAADNANFTFSGAAYVGVGVAMGIDETIAGDQNGDAVLDTSVNIFRPEITSSFTVGMMTTSDMGLEGGASITVDARGASFEDDNTDDAFGTFSEGGFGISNSKVYLSGDWGTVTVTYDDDGSGAGTTGSDWDTTFAYENTWGDFTASVYYTVAIDGVTGTNGDAGGKLTYAFGDYSVWVGYDYDNSDTRVGSVDDPSKISAGATAAFGDFSLGAVVKYYVDNDGLAGAVSDFDWKVNADYTMGAYSVGVFAEDDGYDDNIDFGLSASYALGGGMSVDAAYIYDQDGVDLGGQPVGLAKLGVSMAF